MKYFLYLLSSALLLLITAISGLLFVLFLGNILPGFGVDELQAKNSVPFAMGINVGLLSLFGLQHSVMARKWFKQSINKWISEDLSRIVYNVVSALILLIMIYYWQPIPVVLWAIDTEWLQIILYAFFFLGWLIVLVASMLIDPRIFMGIRQLRSYFLGEVTPPQKFSTPILYKLVRHPIYLGFLIAIWAAPVMTLSHFLLSAGMTVYVMIGIRYEEKDLLATYGNDYRNYQKSTPKLIPRKLSLN